ncbi:AAA family ATPase [Pelagicoccus sp. SDUM812005]|uniref:AAA family ATPase n=1 Tax=Pelagicoccus sp. SDUM812005 TaxID=3041257 RepID=UPI00280E807E|nr:AAA family ATPase [Pelagicoccus sp. SDUM812005]MDQ8182076.1 AAA family ATPase [Pelagicoccus sp. SDUM812005]
MSDEPQEIQALRQALAFSPDNIPLIGHLANALIKYGHFAAAERELKSGLSQDPGNRDLQLALAQAYSQQDKRSEALVVLESLEKKDELGAPGHLLFAKLLSNTTELVLAAEHYKKAIALDPKCEDEEVAAELAPFLIESSDPHHHPNKLPAGDHPGEFETDVQKPKVTFADVGGMDAVKEQIRMKIIHPLKNADLFKAYGKKIGGGVLLYGPPGCGKTHIARATAGEVKANFISIGLHEILSMWIGQSENNLHDLFEQARRNAPSVLFIDEVDAVAANRSDMRQSAGRQLINQFLSELDGIDYSNEGVLVLAATNAPWHLDPAFRRPGRFDQIVFVPPPDLEARTSILQLMLAEKPTEDIDFAKLAKKTEGLTGADLKSIVDVAVEDTLDEAMKTGNIVPLRTKALLKAAAKTKPSSKDWFSSAKNHALYANQSGLYDEILDYLKIKR